MTDQKQQSLNTKDRSTAMRLLEIKRQTETHDGFNQLILKTCLTTSDAMLTKRTWDEVFGKLLLLLSPLLSNSVTDNPADRIFFRKQLPRPQALSLAIGEWCPKVFN